jgi:hypothetical protein
MDTDDKEKMEVKGKSTVEMRPWYLYANLFSTVVGRLAIPLIRLAGSFREFFTPLLPTMPYSRLADTTESGMGEKAMEQTARCSRPSVT